MTAAWTVIAADGSVAADTGADAASLDNHLGREEVEAALAEGSGYAIRRSATLGRDHALRGQRSAHSDNVLRLAVPYSGMREYLPLLFPGGYGQLYAGFGVLHRGDGALCVLGHQAAAGDFPGDVKGQGGLPLPEI